MLPSSSMIAIVDMNIIFEKSRRGRVLTQKLQGVGKQWQENVQKLEERLRKMQAPPPNANREQQAAWERERQGLEMELGYLRQRGDAEIKAYISQSQSQIVEEFSGFLAEYAKQNKIDIVLTIPGAPVLFASDAVNVTTQAMAYYDAKVKL